MIILQQEIEIYFAKYAQHMQITLKTTNELTSNNPNLQHYIVSKLMQQWP